MLEPGQGEAPYMLKYCMTQPRCVLCQFSFVEDEPIIASGSHTTVPYSYPCR